MSGKLVLGVVLAGALVAGCASGGGHEGAGMKVGKEEAQRAAVAKVPGRVLEGKMEPWKGKMYWVFDVATEGTRNITEVAVDPDTGKVVWQGVETPEAREREKKG